MSRLRFTKLYCHSFLYQQNFQLEKFQSKTKRILILVNLTLGVKIPLYLEVFVLHQINPSNLAPLLHLILFQLWNITHLGGKRRQHSQILSLVHLIELVSSVGTAVTNYSVYDKPMHTYIQGLCRLAENESAVLCFADLIGAMTPSHQTSFIKSLFRNSDSGKQVYKVLRGVKPIEQLRPVLVQLLFSRTSFSRPEIFARLICYLSLALEPDQFVKVNIFFHFLH